MFLRIKAIAATGLLLSLKSAVYAATLTSAVGNVTANVGGGFIAAPVATKLKVGDRVMAGPQSSGVITFDNGCSLKINPGEVITVPTDAGCKVASGEPIANPAAAGLSAGAVIGVGVAVGGGAALIALANKKSSSSP